jgi:hypothetical protein
MKACAKHLLAVMLLLFATLTLAQTNSKHVHVKGYYKSNGTYVAPHYRTAPNSSNRDNFSTKPNTNPYTGKKGYIEPDNKPMYNNTNSRPTPTNTTSNTYSNTNNSNATYNNNTYTTSTSTTSKRDPKYSVMFRGETFIRNKQGVNTGYLVRFDTDKILEKYKMYSLAKEYLGYVVFFDDGSYWVYDKQGKIVR